MHGEERHFYREPDHEQNEHPVLLGMRHLRRGKVCERGEIKGPRAGCVGVLGSDIDHARERQHRTEKGVEEELDRRGTTLGAAVDRNQEVHGNERELVSGVEHDRIAREKHADHRCLKQHEPRVVLLLTLLDGGEGADHRQRHEERREQDQHESDCIGAEGKIDAEARHNRDSNIGGRK